MNKVKVVNLFLGLNDVNNVNKRLGKSYQVTE